MPVTTEVVNYCGRMGSGSSPDGSGASDAWLIDSRVLGCGNQLTRGTRFGVAYADGLMDGGVATRAFPR